MAERDFIDVDWDRLRKWAEPLYSLDIPESLEGDQLAAEVAAGFTPGVGTAQGVRDLVRGLRAGDPMEIGLGALGLVPFMGGVTKAVRGARKLPTSVAAARAEGFPLDAPYHSISNRKLDRARRDIEPDEVATRVDDPETKLVRKRDISIDDLEGSILMRAAGDRSARGKIVTEVDGLPLGTPVKLEGGRDYMRDPKRAWASDKGIINALRNKAAPHLEAGKDVNLVYVPMQHGAVDFNTMMSDVMLEQIKAGRHGTQAQIDAVDAVMRQKYPDWPGLMDPGARAALDHSGKMRLRLKQALNSKAMEDAGFPNFGVSRAAITDPELMDTGYLYGGQAVAQLDPGLELLDSGHATYNSAVGGKYLGSLSDEGVPYSIMFPDYYESQMKRFARELPNKNPEHVTAYAFQNPSTFVTQEMRPEVVDNIASYIEALRNR